MGVPKLFHSLIETYHHNNATNPTGYNIIKKDIDNNLPTHFYLDFNGGIYQCIKPEIKTEESLILYVVEYLELLCNCIPNLELIYIALDGIPVYGKIDKQRDRRFHSICRTNRIKKINDTFGSETDKTTTNNNIDTNMITPGTTFMYNLSLAIRRKISEGGSNEIFKGKKVIFNDSSIPGEGEHKLIHHIRDAQHYAIDGNDEERELYGNCHNTVIYALDGDLIFLSLSLHLENIYLFREANEYGNFATVHAGGKKFLYMDIFELSEALIKNFKDTYGCSNDNQIRNRYIDDYIFLGMILGNDFMPKNHWFCIHEGGYERLLSGYFQVHNHTETFLVNKETLQINTEMLCDIWFLVKSQEEEAVTKLFEHRKKARIPMKHGMTEKERQQLLMDFYPLQYTYIEKEIDPYKPNWRSRYYKICLNMESKPENIQLLCQTYIKTLVWNFHYYFNNEPIDWGWYYPYAYAPTFSDIYDELVKHKNINPTGSNKIFHFKNTKPIDQQTLLIMVLPIASKKYMLHDAIHKLMKENSPMHIYFPKKYAINVAFHRYYHDCTPIMYKMELSKVQKFVKDCKFTEDELRRNQQGTLFII
jgi:5'-3' exoribonuclease 2